MHDHIEVFHLLKDRGGFFEAFQELTFVGHRRGRDGSVQRVEVTVLDAGPEKPDERYRTIAMNRDGLRAEGAPGRTIEQSLGSIDWRAFD